MTGSLTGLELFHKKFDLPLAQVIHTEAPYHFRRPDAGMTEEQFRAAIQKVLARHDILLIADEVVTGFGQLGSMFGSDHYGMTPDIVTCAKGLTSAYAPLSGSIIGQGVWDVLTQGTD